MTLCSRSHQVTVGEEGRTILNSLLFFLSLTTEVGCVHVTAMLLLRLLAAESSFRLFEEYPNILCIIVGSRLVVAIGLKYPLVKKKITLALHFTGQ